jgi:hypothetical protein
MDSREGVCRRDERELAGFGVSAARLELEWRKK